MIVHSLYQAATWGRGVGGAPEQLLAWEGARAAALEALDAQSIMRTLRELLPHAGTNYTVVTLAPSRLPPVALAQLVESGANLLYDYTTAL